MRMAPLTGFFGTNSSGKTAILQFLLMLKQTVESNDQSQVLNFGNENTDVELGTLINVIHNRQLPNDLNFALAWDDLNRDPLGQLRLYPIVPKWMRLSTRIHLSENDLLVDEILYTYPSEKGSDQTTRIRRGDNCTVISSDTSEEQVKLPPVKMYDFPQDSSSAKIFHKRNYSFQFEQFCQKVNYLGPIRDYPKRFYSWSGEKPQDVGRRGENTIAALLTARKQDPEIEIKIAYWLKVMGLIDDFKVDLIAPEQRLYQASVRIAPGGTYCPITDVGFGVSQILPVLVLCYYVPQGSTIIFEQPEIHLHPSAQQKLADVFIDVIKHRELQIIIESHSEHLLHRLQRRIAEEELAPEQAALYFCQMEEDGASSLTELELDPFGNIKNWPEDFFGDDMGDLVAMTDAAMQRQMVQEAS